MSYDSTIIGDGPSFYLTGTTANQGSDLTIPALTTVGTPSNSSVILPNGDAAWFFNNPAATSQSALSYFSLPDPSDAALSISKTGALTVELWFSLSATAQPWEIDTGYVNMLCKVASDYSEREWEFRYFGSDTTESPSDNEPTNCCFYQFQTGDETGAGYDDHINSKTANTWYYMCGVYDYTSSKTITIYGAPFGGSIVSNQQTGISLSASHQTCPLLIGCGETDTAGGSSSTKGSATIPNAFYGSLGKIAIYDKALSSSQVSAHFAAMASGGGGAVTGAASGAFTLSMSAAGRGLYVASATGAAALSASAAGRGLYVASATGAAALSASASGSDSEASASGAASGALTASASVKYNGSASGAASGTLTATAVQAYGSGLSVASLLSGEGAAPLTTASVSAASNSLLVLWVAYPASPNSVTGVAGLGLTWTRQESQSATAGASIECWTAPCPSPISGGIGIQMNGPYAVAYEVTQVTGQSASAPVVNPIASTGNAITGVPTGATWTPVAAPATNDLVVMGCVVAGVETQSPAPGWTVLAQPPAAGSVSMAVQVSPLSPGAGAVQWEVGSMSGTVAYAAVGFELAAAAGTLVGAANGAANAALTANASVRQAGATVSSAATGTLTAAGVLVVPGGGLTAGIVVTEQTVVSDLTSGVGNGTSQTTAVITPVANSLLVVWVGHAVTGGSTVSVSGLGLTWTQQAAKTASSSTGLSVFTAPVGGTPPSAGALTITSSVAATSLCWDVNQVLGVSDTDPVVTTNTKTANGSGTAAALTMSGRALLQDSFIYGVVENDLVNLTPGAGLTPFANVQESGPSLCMLTAEGVATSPSVTGSSGTALWAMIGLEVAALSEYSSPGTLTLGGTVSVSAVSVAPEPVAAASAYDEVVQADAPRLYLPSSQLTDAGAGAHAVSAVGGPLATTFLPNNEPCYVFNGVNQYLQVASAADLSVTDTGAITIEGWIRPDTLSFPTWESTGYVHLAGKGTTYGSGGNQEYMLRMYNLNNTESPERPSRISGYAFNPAGGLGVGSYSQQPVSVSEWIHVGLVINTTPISGNDANGYPYDKGYTKLYINGQLAKSLSGANSQNALDEPGFAVIVPVAGAAPLCIGSGDLVSFFLGAIGKFAVYDGELSATRFAAHYDAMMTPSVTSAPGVITIGGSAVASVETAVPLPVPLPLVATFQGADAEVGDPARAYGFPYSFAGPSASLATVDITAQAIGDLLVVGVTTVSREVNGVASVSGGGVDEWQQVSPGVPIYWGVVSEIGLQQVSVAALPSQYIEDVVVDELSCYGGIGWTVQDAAVYLTAIDDTPLGIPIHGAYWSYLLASDAFPTGWGETPYTPDFTYTVDALGNAVVVGLGLPAGEDIAPSVGPYPGASWKYNWSQAMFVPIVPRFGETLFARMAPWRAQPWWTEDGDMLLYALASMFEPVAQLAEDVALPGQPGYVPGWGVLLDVDLCPYEYLPFLAQFNGSVLPAGLSDAAARAYIREEPQQKRGTPGAIISAAQRGAGPGQTVTLLERTGWDGSSIDPYNFVLIVVPGGLPAAGPCSVATITANVNAKKPAGVTWQLVQTPAWTIAQLEAAYATVALVESAFTTVTNVELNNR